MLRWQLRRNASLQMFKVFAFDFETRIKTNSLSVIAWSMKLCILHNSVTLISTLLLTVSSHRHTSLVSDKHIPACRFPSVSPGYGALVLFHAARRESEWRILLWCLAAQTFAARHLSSCLQLLPFRAPRVRESTELLRHKTPDFTPDLWLPNRPDLSSVNYRLLRVIQECVYQKQQKTSNIVDEMWLLTEWHYISHRIETFIRRGGQFCCSFVANLIQYTIQYICVQKAIKIQCGLTKLLQ